MNDELDQLLARLAERSANPDLDAMSRAVLGRVTTPVSRATGMPLAAGLAATLAIGVGMASGWSERAEARPAAVLDAGQALAPSTLLGGG